jgi:hypothetical protein
MTQSVPNAETAPPLTGGCQCGAVRYTLLDFPDHVSVCYCRMCQKASGGPFMAFARVKASALRWTRGTPSLFASSNLVERGFCSRCGTPLTYHFIERENVSVTIGSLDDPESVRPQMQYVVETAPPWLSSIGAIPRCRPEDFIGPELMARFISYQHPDRDTDGG